MANLQRRGEGRPRRAREQHAYRLVQAGAATGGLGVLTLVLAVLGVVGAGLPIFLLLATALIAWRFMRITGQR
ncbi:MAG: hypothetical protein ACRDKL_07690 [Solirubrobacteraceae bacterium]